MPPKTSCLMSGKGEKHGNRTLDAVRIVKPIDPVWDHRMPDFSLLPQPGVKRSALLNLPLPHLLHILP